MLGDAVTEEGDSGGGEDALLAVDSEASLLETGKKLAHMLNVDIMIWARDKDVIQIHKKKRQAPQDAVHKALEGLGRVF